MTYVNDRLDHVFILLSAFNAPSSMQVWWAQEGKFKFWDGGRRFGTQRLEGRELVVIGKWLFETAKE